MLHDMRHHLALIGELARENASKLQSYIQGVGLSSVKAICGKHRGLVQYEIAGDVWKSSALVRVEYSRG